MRRMLAITLLIAFGSPLILPLFAAAGDSQASLPACCRRHGLHRCSMAAMTGQTTGPTFNAPVCPLYPSAFIPCSLAATPHAASVLLYAGVVGSAESLRARTFPARTHNLSSNLKRGPPGILA